MKFFFALLLFLHLFITAGEIPGDDFNSYVLFVLKEYPTNGAHDYYWPVGESWAGNTCDLFYQERLFAKGDVLGRCYCCGLTFEVFFKAYHDYCNKSGWQFTIGNFDFNGLISFRKEWFGSNGDKKTHYNAIIANKLGKHVDHDNAQAGDFVQFWRNNGSGHSVIFIGWIRENDKIVGISYWSTQKSTKGIGYRDEYIGSESSEIDIDKLYIARVGK